MHRNQPSYQTIRYRQRLINAVRATQLSGGVPRSMTQQMMTLTHDEIYRVLGHLSPDAVSTFIMIDMTLNPMRKMIHTMQALHATTCNTPGCC
jgi:hypothetical protein